MITWHYGLRRISLWLAEKITEEGYDKKWWVILPATVLALILIAFFAVFAYFAMIALLEG